MLDNSRAEEVRAKTVITSRLLTPERNDKSKNNINKKIQLQILDGQLRIIEYINYVLRTYSNSQNIKRK